MKKSIIAILFIFFTSLCYAQPVSYPGLAKRLRNGTTLPATCAVGDVFFDTDATSGQRFYACESANTWVLQGDGGGGGSGDVTDVGDCATGACFTGTTGNTLTFKGTTSGTTALKPTAVAGTTTITMPAETGTMCTSASVCSGYQASLGYTPVNAADWTTINSYPAGCAANSFVNTIGDTLTCGTSISGNSATATALAANGVNCSAGSYPLGVDTAGASESCTTAASTAADFITGSAQTTLSAEQSLGALTTSLLLNTVAASTGTLSAYGGTSCTNQFLRSLNASGAATCANVGAADITNGIIDGTELASNTKIVSFGITIDGGGSAITTGVKGYVEIPFAMTITGNTFLCDQSGSIVVDVWKDTYANYPPTVADTITASAKPTITTATKSQDTTLTGWTTSVSAGDIIGFNVDSASTVTRCHLIIKGNKL